MTTIDVFLWGVGGSIAIEVVNLYHIYQPNKIVIPTRYTKISFWIIRSLLAIMAGGLAVAYNIDNPILAVNIGAATPLVLQALSKGIQPQLADIPNQHHNLIGCRSFRNHLKPL